MIDRKKVIKGLQIERECVSRDCDRDCGKCDLVQDRDWLLSVYDDAIAMLKEKRKPDCEHAEHDGIGCLGYARCTQDDEPIEACKNCCTYTGNRYEEMNRDA